MDIIVKADLPVALQGHELIDLWLDGANAKAMRVAPCLGENPASGGVDEARLILLGAIKRWSEAGSGSVQAQAAGPFSQTIDTRQRGGYNLWPSEITDLQAICKTGQASGAFSVDTAPMAGSMHLPWCSGLLGATYCSCGVDIAGSPIFEGAFDVP